MNKNLNKIENIFFNNLKKGKLKSPFWAKIFRLLNKGNTYWHLVAKTQDEELLNNISQSSVMHEINSYNKDGILPIHQYLSSIICFKDDDKTFYPYFNFNESFFNKFLEQKPILDKFWIYPIYSSWKKSKQEKNIKGQHLTNSTLNFDFPSTNIVGYPSEMIYLIFKDIFLYHELPDSVYIDNYPIYEKIFKKLYTFDKKDLDVKKKIEQQITPDKNKNFFTEYISDFMVLFVSSPRDFIAIIPLLSSEHIDYERKSRNDGHTILHNIFGKLNKHYSKLSQSQVEQLLMAISTNKKFDLKYLETPNNFGSSPISLLKANSNYIIPFFKSIRLNLQLKEHMDNILKEKNIILPEEQSYEEIEDEDEHWKL